MWRGVWTERFMMYNKAAPCRNSSTNKSLVLYISGMLDLHCLLIYPMIFWWDSSVVVTTISHYHGGCLVGKVVDRNLRLGHSELLMVQPLLCHRAPIRRLLCWCLAAKCFNMRWILHRSAIATNRELAYVNERVDIPLDNWMQARLDLDSRM